MSVTVFLSTVSDEFRPYRDLLRADLERHNVHVKVQEDFKNLGGDTLDKLDVYIAHCEAVVHLVGDMTGAVPGAREQAALLAKYPDIAKELPPLGEALKDGAAISYTQWEAWLALYHGKLLLIAKAADAAERGPAYARPGDKGAAQIKHLARLEAVRRYPGCTFASPADLAKHIAYTAILDLLVKDYAKEIAREHDAAIGSRDIAIGFINEMATKVAADPNLDFDGKKQAVRNALDIYEREIAGGPTQTNFGTIVDAALASAKRQVDEGKSRLAGATLRKAAEEMQREDEKRRREEKERRERHVEGVMALYNRARDIALASYDGEAAAEAVVALAEAVHGADRAGVYEALAAETKALYEHGRDRGSNVHLVAAIAVSRKLLDAASSGDERGAAHNILGMVLGTLGERESGAAWLEEAVGAFHAALEELARERVPLQWAMTQNNLGETLRRLGEREGGTTRLHEAVRAFRAALEDATRERVPLRWAMTQDNLGNALKVLGERESGTARLDQAVVAYREALEERTRERVPLEWAKTQNNLGNSLARLGERESGTARLEEAVAAYRAALEERTREQLPLGWAMTQNNLGCALAMLGERERGAARFEEAIAAFREALKERTPEAAPYWHDQTQQKLANCLALLEQRRKS